MTTNKQILTPGELAALFGRSKSWVVARCQDGTLPCVRVGSRWVLKRAELVREGWLPADDEMVAATGKVAATGREDE